MNTARRCARTVRKLLAMTLAGAAAIGGMVLLSAAPFAGRVEPAVLRTSEKDLAVLKDLQDQAIDPEHPMRLQVDVDYAEGEAGAWYPKDESPVLKGLVAAGELPPVAERAGSEPLVLRGVEGAGRYGGSMYNLKDLGGARMTCTALVRWSPQGEPLVPNVARAWTVSDGGKTYTFQLRRGMKWSDGAPFTSADLLYWWQDEVMDPAVNTGSVPDEFVHRGRPATVTAPDASTIRFSFVAPNALFLERLAGHPWMCESPRHFLEKFHPTKGDRDLIRRVMRQHNLINEKAVYSFVRNRIEKPSLAPWIVHTERTTPPTIYVRNPYYWAVDEAGRQLPYTDRIVLNDKSMDMLGIAAAQGEVTVQGRYIRGKDYTMLMRQRAQYGYQVYHYINGDGADWGLCFNLNRRFDRDDVHTAQKARLLADKRFRQALSLAVDRQAIVDALFAGLAEPRQMGSMPPSPFYFPDFVDEYGRFDPVRAGSLLDAIGLTARDTDGYRCFPGGPPLLFDINYCSFTGEGPGEFIVDDWRKAGIHARLRAQDRSVFYIEKAAGLHDMSAWGAYGDFNPLLEPRYYFPYSGESNFAVRYGIWYGAGGMFAEDQTRIPGERPPAGSPLLEGMRLYEQAKLTTSFEERRAVFRKMLALAAENVYMLTFYTPLPQLVVVKDGYRNVPKKGIYSWPFLSPSNLGPETWYWESPRTSPDEERDIAAEVRRIAPQRPLVGAQDGAAAAPTAAHGPAAGRIAGAIVKRGLALAVVLLVVLAVLRSPYVARRLLIMVPTLLVISIISFVVIELPPGDAITSKIMQMQERGGQVDQTQIDDIKALFRTEQPAWKRYTWWMGFDWFLSLDRKDQGLLQGNMGRSMLDLQPVNEKVGDRILFTFLLSLGTILFTWAVALPIGIYSAVKQYSLFDYIFTVGGFIGMCIPGFLLALLLMYGAEALFGLNVSGLLSPEYSAQPGWPAGKVADLLKHLWLPVLVQGVTGTAGMIRVMRANLLDELKKPYVVTARAKGVRPLRLLLKYPVRVALNPFISGIGGILPALISGGAIVSIVMSLPTIGPMQLDAVMQQDMYLAGSMLMILSTLSVIGTLLSDLLLAAVDPRIRFQGGSR